MAGRLTGKTEDALARADCIVRESRERVARNLERLGGDPALVELYRRTGDDEAFELIFGDICARKGFRRFG